MLRPSLSLIAPVCALAATLSAQGELIQVPGTDATVRIQTVDGELQSAVSRDGGATWFQQNAPRHALSFRSGAFDPLDGAPPVPPSLMASNDNRLFYVQFKTDIIPEYRTALERMGAEVLYHFPHQSYIVRMERGQVSDVVDQGYVRAVADMHVAYKLEQSLVNDLIAGGGEVQTFDLMLANKHTDAASVERAARELGLEVVGAANGGILVTVKATAQQVATLARRSDVLWAEPLGEIGYDIDNFRVVAGVNNVVAQTGTEFGKGMTGHVVEGIYTTHCEFQARPPWRIAPIHVPANGQNGSAGSGHGTNTAGEIYAEGLRADAMGIMPWAQMTYTNSSAINGTNNRYPQTQVLTDPTGPYWVSFQTASWGYPRSTQYTSRSAEMDDILADMNLLVTNSQSNSGSTPSRPQAWAKNVFGIGGFNHFDNTDPNDDCHCNTGSTGPAADGRVGVTFASFYDSILTTSGTGCSYSTSFGGTSGATPTVNGLAGATIELWTDGTWGGPAADISDPTTATANRFALRPKYTTVRALMSMGTDQVDITQSTRVEQGWGRPNIQTIYDNAEQILAIDELDVLSQGESATYIVYVPPGTDEFRASMHHAEEEAVPNAIPTRHNSVDLTVVDPSGAVWHGNKDGIMVSHYSVAPNGEVNDVDVHENIWIQNPAAGVYSVSVTAAAITMDNHKETAAVDLDFGLAIRGIGGGRDTSDIVLDMDSTGAGNWTVAASNLPASWSTGFTVMSVDTSRNLGFGEFFGLRADGLASASLLSPVAAGNVFHFTNAAGQYPHTTFNFPAAVALAVQGLTFDGLVFLLDGSGNVVGMSNVDRVTVQ